MYRPTTVLLLFLSAGILLIAFDSIYHKNVLAALRANRVIAPKKLGSYLCPNVVGALPFLAHWSIIVSAVIGYSLSTAWAIDVLMLGVVGAQMRALQEISHFSVHRSLCASSAVGDILANALFQWPMLLEDVCERRKKHFRHHAHANTSRDPNVETFRGIGMTPVLSKHKFMYYVFFPITPRGIWLTIGNMYMAVRYRNCGKRILLCLVAATYMVLFFLLGVLKEFLLLFVLARVLCYPWLSWISVLVEHRWFVSDIDRKKGNVEFHIGRPTVYKGVTGVLARVVLFPYGDSYHLVHSLYTRVRYNFLPYLDAYCFATVAEYREHYSVGLIWPDRSGRPSALSELYFRMTRGHLEKFRCPVMVERNINGLGWGRGPEDGIFRGAPETPGGAVALTADGQNLPPSAARIRRQDRRDC